MLELSSSLRLKFLPTYESPTTPIPRPEIRCPMPDFVGIGLPIPSIRISSFEPRTSKWVWAIPVSLAATWGIEFSLFSSGYLDVSVPRLAFSKPIYSA